jgi:hypothetical protein
MIFGASYHTSHINTSNLFYLGCGSPLLQSILVDQRRRFTHAIAHVHFGEFDAATTTFTASTCTCLSSWLLVYLQAGEYKLTIMPPSHDPSLTILGSPLIFSVQAGPADDGYVIWTGPLTQAVGDVLRAQIILKDNQGNPITAVAAAQQNASLVVQGAFEKRLLKRTVSDKAHLIADCIKPRS